MKKLITIFCSSVLFFNTSTTWAQDYEFTHALGGTYMYAILDEGINGAAAVTYAPRINFYKLSRNASLSLNANLSLSYSFSTSTNSVTESSSAYAYELPVSINYNFGHGSWDRSRKDFGGYFGAGYAVNSIERSTFNELTGTISNSSGIQGIYIEGGTRFRPKKLERTVSLGLYAIKGNDSLYGLRFLVQM